MTAILSLAFSSYSVLHSFPFFYLLAVLPEARSKGYDFEIVRAFVLKKYGNPMFMHVEHPDKTALAEALARTVLGGFESSVSYSPVKQQQQSMDK